MSTCCQIRCMLLRWEAPDVAPSVDLWSRSSSCSSPLPKQTGLQTGCNTAGGGPNIHPLTSLSCWPSNNNILQLICWLIHLVSEQGDRLVPYKDDLYSWMMDRAIPPQTASMNWLLGIRYSHQTTQHILRGSPLNQI